MLVYTNRTLQVFHLHLFNVPKMILASINQPADNVSLQNPPVFRPLRDISASMDFSGPIAAVLRVHSNDPLC